jgi:hypothetical protein
MESSHTSHSMGASRAPRPASLPREMIAALLPDFLQHGVVTAGRLQAKVRERRGMSGDD